MMAFSAGFEKSARHWFPEGSGGIGLWSIEAPGLVHTPYHQHRDLPRKTRHTLNPANTLSNQDSMLLQLSHWGSTPNHPPTRRTQTRRGKSLPWLTYLGQSWPPSVMSDIKEAVLTSDDHLSIRQQPTYVDGVEAALKAGNRPNWASLMVLKCLYFDILPPTLYKALADRNLGWMLQSGVKFSDDGQHFRDCRNPYSPWVQYRPPAMLSCDIVTLFPSSGPYTLPACSGTTHTTLAATSRLHRALKNYAGLRNPPQVATVSAFFVTATLTVAAILITLDLAFENEHTFL